ncbi:MAG: hypothetical protein UT83_C0011G0005 [Parcubacteria group bacterium GW2011_GWA2_40_143]|nr:MAG: hypothetical protein UT83_C0011G0005 [Parcubacteria group bacterium GW2011_GWA2_40_143]
MKKKENLNIELELRAEVSSRQFYNLLEQFKKQSKFVSSTKRLSAMFLSKINGANIDIRVRIDSNGKTEIVAKKGDFHAHNRTELSQKINKDQFIGIIKTFALFGFNSKITERENFVFDLGNDIDLTQLIKLSLMNYAIVFQNILTGLLTDLKNILKNWQGCCPLTD